MGDLRVTIKGPSDQATALLQQILGLGDRQPRALSPSASDLSLDLVSHGGDSAPRGPSVQRAETRAEIEATFDSCPAHLLDSAKKLSGSALSGEDRARRAKAYGKFAETINAVAQARPVIRKQLVGAWDLAYAWLSDEPGDHHPALPLSILLSMVSLVEKQL